MSPIQQCNVVRNTKDAYMGDYPTLGDLNRTVDIEYATAWLIPHLTDLALFCGVRPVSETQFETLATMISMEFPYLKISEMIVFFYNFKKGKYETFYGTFSPHTIMRSLMTFKRERDGIISRYEAQERWEKRQKEIEEWKAQRAEVLEYLESDAHKETLKSIGK